MILLNKPKKAAKYKYSEKEILQMEKETYEQPSVISHVHVIDEDYLTNIQQGVKMERTTAKIKTTSANDKQKKYNHECKNYHYKTVLDSDFSLYIDNEHFQHVHSVPGIPVSSGESHWN